MSQWSCLTTPTPPGERLLALPSGLGVSPAALAKLEELTELTELPLFCFEAETGILAWQSDPELLPYCPMSRRMRLWDVSHMEIVGCTDGLAYFLFPLPQSSDESPYVVGGYCLTESGVHPRDLVLESIDANWELSRLESMLDRLPVCPERMLCKLLPLAVEHVREGCETERLELDHAELTWQIEAKSQETSLLHDLVQNLQLSRSAEELAVLCVRRLHGLVNSAGHAICLELSDDHVQFLVEGRLPFDEASLARLLSRFDQHDWSQPLVRNQLQQSLLGADFPGLQNLIVAPIGEGSTRRGWIICVNARGGRDYTAGEAVLLASIAAILGTHARNLDFFSKHEELLLSFVRSLVSTLDAKDPYTRGHSERVALIAHKLGQQLQLPNSDLDDIYLSGLLHDLGKIGVDDRVLRKPDQLTAEEFQHIQQHPLIGFQILSQLKSLAHILPGVRSHHESMNGKGYPDRLRGDEIPLMARIIAVADAYDAMCSDRPYRKGMPVEKLEDIFRRGSGEQWDPRVIDAYFQVRDEIIRMCEDYSPTAGNLLSERPADRSSGITMRTFLRHEHACASQTLD